MRISRLPLLGLAGLSLVRVSSAAELPAAELRSHLTGQLHVGNDWVLPWVVELQQSGSGATTLALSAEVFESDVRATFAKPAEGEGRWKIEQAEWPIRTVWSHVAEAYAPALAALQPEGRLNVYGEGTWTDAGPVGPLQLTWADAAVTSTDPEFSIEKLELALELTEWWSDQRVGQGAIRFGRLNALGFELRDAIIALALYQNGTLHLGPGRMAAFDGTLVVAPVEWSGRGPFTVTVQAVGLSLAKLAALAPQVVRSASGTVSGQVVLRWDEKQGLTPIDGHLVIDSQRTVDLTLGSRPGFLTRQVPRRYQFLPSWLGGLGRKLAPVNPAYEMLEGIELGRVPLRVERLEVEFYPPDDPLQRTARIEIDGRPTDGKVIDRVSIRLNLSGPLADIIRLGLDDRTQISGRLK